VIPEKLALGLDPGVEAGFPKRSCSNKRLERDDDSKKSHPALGEHADQLDVSSAQSPRKAEAAIQ
jgi:hypothetical protein